MKVCGKITGVNLIDHNKPCKVMALEKAWPVFADPSHPLFNDFMLLPYGHRHCQPNAEQTDLQMNLFLLPLFMMCSFNLVSLQ